MTHRALLIGSIVLTTLCLLASARADRPASGEATPAFAPVDQAITDFMDRIEATAATVAVYQDGKLVHSRGFGWRDKECKEPVAPDALMRIASISKPFTAALIRDLIREKKLEFDTKAFAYLNIEAPAGATPDPRLNEITIKHLLQHTGGWDRDKAGDPMFKIKDVTKALSLMEPAKPMDVLRYMLSQPLQFAPGEKSVYSNFGYCVLGRVVEKATGQTYAEALRQRLAEPIKIAADVKVGRTSSKERDPREVYYPVKDETFSLDVMDSHGGMIASAPALGAFMQKYWISGAPRAAGAKGVHLVFMGSLPGTTSLIIQRPDGTDVAVLLNSRRSKTIAEDNDLLRKTVTEAMDGVIAVQKGGIN